MSSLLLFRVACRFLIFYLGGSLVWHSENQSEWAVSPACSFFLLSTFYFYLLSISLFCSVLLLLFASPFYHCFNSLVMSSLWSICVLVWFSCFYLYLVVSFFFFWVFRGLYCCVPRPFCTHWLPISCFPFPVLCGWAENRQSVVSSRHVAVRTLSFHRGE